MRRRKRIGSAALISSPSTLIRPPSASISRLASRSSVVLPEPEPPAMAAGPGVTTGRRLIAPVLCRELPLPLLIGPRADILSGVVGHQRGGRQTDAGADRDIDRDRSGRVEGAEQPGCDQRRRAAGD